MIWISEFSRGCHHHVLRNRDADIVITQFQSELAAPNELLVLPTCVIGVRDHPRKPLRDFVDVIPVLLKELMPRSTGNQIRVDDVVGVVDREANRFTRHHGFGEIDAHHRFVDGVLECVALLVLD